MRAAPALLAALMAAAVIASRPSADTCGDCLRARYWPVEDEQFPETKALVESRPRALDLGVAFSGGGTRSATAALGQLRGLQRNHWLDRVRYVAAVSGGGWAAITFTYAMTSMQQLLDEPVDPGALAYEPVVGHAGGLLADAIVKSSLSASSYKEAMSQAAQAALKNDKDEFLRKVAQVALKRRESDRRDKTFGRLLGDVFIDPIVDPREKKASDRLFSWTDPSVDDIIHDNERRFSHIDFVTYDPAQRPFLIVGGTIVDDRSLYDYPVLMPVEYTPLYSGVRQRFGQRFGGTYIASWAYDHMPVASPLDEGGTRLLRVSADARVRKFSLADIAASTGAAPQLALLMGARAEPLPDWARRLSATFATFFPHYRHVRIDEGADVEISAPMAHGDGGFTDNLGVMPLLARHVKNVLVFVNAKNEFDQNDDLASYFEPVPDPGPSGNKSLNQVFSHDKYDALKSRFRSQLAAGKPLVFCDSGWSVSPNHLYRITGYGDLNICWIYNHDTPQWTAGIKDARVRRLLNGDEKADQNAKGFKTFPWYETFEQNKPHLIQLTIPQVNLLANLASWTITNAEVADYIRGTIKGLP